MDLSYIIHQRGTQTDIKGGKVILQNRKIEAPIENFKSENVMTGCILYPMFLYYQPLLC